MYQHNVIGITGRFGSGKSLRAMELACRFSNRMRKPIVCNFPLNVGALRAYAKAMGFNWVASCARILSVSTFDDINEIWRYRDTVFVLDEAGVFLNSRNWKSTGKEFLRNLFQVRHLNVHLLVIFQNAAQVDKQLRENIQHWIVCKSQSVYSVKLKAPRLIARFCYHYNVEKFLRLQDDVRARGNAILPWLWAENVSWRYLFVFDLLAFSKNSLCEIYDAFLYLFSGGSKRFRFVRFRSRESWLFGIYSSTDLVGTRMTVRTSKQLAPFITGDPIPPVDISELDTLFL